MACSGRYAEAWQYASFWCVGVVLSRVDNGGGAGLAYLTDTMGNFIENGVQANVGMTLYNLTTGLDGPITAVTASTVTATGVLWTDGDAYRLVIITALEQAIIETYLDVAASDLHAAMAASGMCDCTLASWATGYLQKLNIIDAAVYHTCTCGQPKLSDDMRKEFLRWCSTQLKQIRVGETELCQGATGSDYPAIGWAQQSLTEFATAEIILNYDLANRS